MARARSDRERSTVASTYPLDRLVFLRPERRHVFRIGRRQAGELLGLFDGELQRGVVQVVGGRRAALAADPDRDRGRHVLAPAAGGERVGSEAEMGVILALHADGGIVGRREPKQLVAEGSGCRSSESSMVRRSGGGVENVDLAKAGDRAPMADGIGLRRFAFAVAEQPVQFVGRLAAKTVAGIPEVCGARLISDVAQHAGDLARLDLPERLAAELEVVPLLVDRPTAVAVDQNAVLDAADQIVERDVFRGRCERHVGHARKRHAPPTVGVQAAVGLVFADQRRQIARRLPIHEHAVLDQIPALRRDAFVVVADGRQPLRLRPVGEKVAALAKRTGVSRSCPASGKLVPAKSASHPKARSSSVEWPTDS